MKTKTKTKQFSVYVHVRMFVRLYWCGDMKLRIGCQFRTDDGVYVNGGDPRFSAAIMLVMICQVFARNERNEETANCSRNYRQGYTYLLALRDESHRRRVIVGSRGFLVF